MYTIECGTDTRGDAARTALARAPADEVALAFPLGAACALSDPAALEALRAYCDSLGKRAVVIGGDQTLRAHAVAAGFAVATSLEEWETAKRKAVRRRRLSLGPASRKRSRDDPAPAEMRVVREPQGIAEESAAGLYDPVGEDPPSYVADLMAADAELSPIERQSQIPTIPLQRARITRRLEELQREAAAAAALDRAHQEYEEQVTRTIRATGAPATSAPETPENPADAAEGVDNPPKEKSPEAKSG